MALKLKSFDASKHFATTEAQERLLNDALESGEAGYIANAIGTVAKARGMSRLADETGLNRTALYAALNTDGNPSLDTILRVLDALGLELHTSRKMEKANVMIQHA